MKPYRFSKDKDKFLKEKRGVGFSEIIKALEERQILKSTDYPNKKKFPNQKMMLVKIKKYIYVVPYVESEKEFFLKTIYPSRKYTKKYLSKKL
ncbi:toxin [Candidatus Roizmanbacteria bacterium RIFCSPHIGHO2_01_FULL_35_10]|uniref:Toxin n=1 Tax=Candidatus Roizmanbacteria bacterium RIFCSPLOWO2_01_FULL_35_13 TaxID=1802055 RepID=A0A1F7I778_9BACT|nr:MAG: toxin [Candidatus Roizmanbacteria bacterium RIFCSPHIGHO2_01_FULL_35_10]OGK39229.1 MAG: toxin [Candidatus Roizmanbacteria bacterium RIFCSPLOWO2_01_FULL_35_13]